MWWALITGKEAPEGHCMKSEGEAYLIMETPACGRCLDCEASAEENCRHEMEPAQEKGDLSLSFGRVGSQL